MAAPDAPKIAPYPKTAALRFAIEYQRETHRPVKVLGLTLRSDLGMPDGEYVHHDYVRWLESKLAEARGRA